MTSTRTPALTPTLQQLRAVCPLVERSIYLANCSQAPQATLVRAAIQTFLDEWAELGMHWGGWIEEVERARAAFAALIGAEPEDIAIGASVSQLVASLASALMQPGATRRRILSSVVEFPCVPQAWHAATRAVSGWRLDLLTGSEAEVIEADRLAAARASLPTSHTHPAIVVNAQQIAAAIDATTALVSAPQVGYTNGALLDVQAAVEAAHAQGALFLLDAYQGIGSVPIDVQKAQVDFLVAGTLKYLLGTAGIAFLYVRPQVREQLEPAATGWFGRANPFDYNPAGLEYASGGSRFDLGTPALINAFAARAGMELIHKTGVAEINAQINRLSALAYRAAPERGLNILGPQPGTAKGATTAIDAGSLKRSQWLEGELRKQRVIVSARGEAIRLAPHGFTLESELEQALDAVAALLKQAPAELAVS